MTPFDLLLLFTTLLLFGLCIVYVWMRCRLAQARAEYLTLRETLDALTHRIDLMGQAALPIGVVLQRILVKELTHFHTPRIDALLAKLGPPFALTAKEEAELLAALDARQQDRGTEIPESEREAARILPAIINRVRRDLAATTLETVLQYQMVSIVPPDEEDSPRR